MDRPPPPRAQHYLFAHRLLPNTMFGAGRAVFPTMCQMAANGHAERGLRHLWEGAREMASQGGTAEIIEGEPTARAVRDGILIRMPAPTRMPEALFIAIVERRGELRYFTLEYSVGGEFAMCEWRAGGQHANLGPLAGDETAFLAAVDRHFP